MRRFFAIVAALLIAALPARADFGAGGQYLGFWAGSQPVVLYRAPCVAITDNLTEYTVTVVPAGLSDSTPVLIVLGILSEDGASDYGVSSATIEGVAATEIVDDGGVGIDSSAMYTSATVITGAASVEAVVTFTEEITSTVFCAWALENLSSITATSVNSDHQALEVALDLTLATNTVGGYAIGLCGSSNGASDFTWAVLNEVEDTDSVEISYSNADGVTTGSSMAVTCTSTAGASNSGSAAAFR